MPKARIEFNDGSTLTYDDVGVDYEHRVVVIYKTENQNEGFIPFEAIVALSWIEDNGDNNE